MKLVAKAHPIEKWRWLLEQPTRSVCSTKQKRNENGQPSGWWSRGLI